MDIVCYVEQDESGSISLQAVTDIWANLPKCHKSIEEPGPLTQEFTITIPDEKIQDLFTDQRNFTVQ